MKIQNTVTGLSQYSKTKEPVLRDGRRWPRVKIFTLNSVDLAPL
jgi:hypothetical protein